MTPNQSSQSQTKARIIARFENNALLQSAILSPMRSSTLDLSVDQPTMAPLPDMIASSLGALERGETHYVDVFGIAPLRERIVLYLQGMGISQSALAWVMAVAGMQECRFLTLQKLGETLGPIGLPTIVYPGARRLALGTRELASVEIAAEITDDAMTSALPSPAAIEASLQEGAKLLYLESPSRLTGASYDAATLYTIATLVEQYDAAVIWDQGLAPWVEKYVSLASLPNMGDRVVVIGEAWPGMGLESWPISYIGGKSEWLEPIRSQKQIMAICTNTASQYAALAASYQYAEVHSEQMKQLAAARQALIAKLAATGAEPLAGDTLSLLALRASEAVTSKLEAAGIQWADGAIFGAPGIVRLAVTADDTLPKSLA